MSRPDHVEALTQLVKKQGELLRLNSERITELNEFVMLQARVIKELLDGLELPSDVRGRINDLFADTEP